MLCEFSGVKSQLPKQPATPVLEASSTFTPPIRTLDLGFYGDWEWVSSQHRVHTRTG